MKASYKGVLGLGLLSTSVSLYNIIKSNDYSFKMIDKKTMSQIHYKKTCTDDSNKEVTMDDVVKGYEYAKGKYVIFDDEDYKKVISEVDKIIIIKEFVKPSQIDWYAVEKCYYLLPTQEDDEVFELIKKAIEKSRLVGIAKAVIGNKESLMMIRAKNHKLYLSTLYFHDEIQELPVNSKKLLMNKETLSLTIDLIKAMKKDFIPQLYINELNKRIEDAISYKVVNKIDIKQDVPGTNLISSVKESMNKLNNQIE
jgi:DNA end-binding protein Ku